jgi:hypothetical protein
MYKVYKVTSKKDESTVYIGSTKHLLNTRLSQHKSDSEYFGGFSERHRWMLENCDALEITEIREAVSKKEALDGEKAEVKKHIEQGYNVLNIAYNPHRQYTSVRNTCTTKPRTSALPDNHHITYEQQYRKCGKVSCSTCSNGHGQGHGPYWYAYWREGNKLKSAYIGKEKKEQSA